VSGGGSVQSASARYGRSDLTLATQAIDHTVEEINAQQEGEYLQ